MFTNSLSSIACSGRLPVVFDGGSAEDVAAGVTVPVCTLDAANAATLIDKIIVKLDIGANMCHGSLAVSENGDGTASILATFKTHGLHIRIR